VRQKPLCIQLPRQQGLQRSTPQDQTPRTQFDPVPMKYAEFLSMLLERNLVQTKAPPAIPKKLLARFKADLLCAFHQGAPGHDVKHCYALKNAVQDLIQANILSSEGQPQVQQWPQQQCQPLCIQQP